MLPQSTSYGAPGRITLAGYMQNSRGIGRPSMRVLGSYALVLLLEGGGQFRDGNGVRRAVGRGNMLMIFPDVPHAYGPQAGQRWDEFFLVFEGAVFDAWRQSALLAPATPVLPVEDVDLWWRRMEEAVAPDVLTEPERSLRQLCRLQELLAELALIALQQNGTQSTPESAWLQHACALLVNEPRIGVPPLDGPQVARVLQMPYESFRKKFVALAGVSPGQYRARRLLERAGELLQHGQLNNRQIAARLGFCDEFHFSRQFKKHHGASPRDWKMRQNEEP